MRFLIILYLPHIALTYTRLHCIGHLYKKKTLRITQALAYKRHELDHLYERGLYKMRSARINGSRLIRE